MTEDGYASWRSWFEAYVRAFRGEDGVLCAPLELKRRHSMRVAENARQIGCELGLEGAELELADAAGLLHDVGRFTQFAQYGSFSDADTIDHGEEGRVVLEQAPSRLFTCHHDRERLLLVVRYHNCKAEDIPAELSRSQLALLRLVRDADKIDILHIVLGSVEENGFQELPTMLPAIRLSRELSPDILARAASRESVSTASLATLGDFLVMMSTWFHDLSYAPARRLAAGRGYLARLRRELPNDDHLDRYFEGLAASCQLPTTHQGD